MCVCLCGNDMALPNDTVAFAAWGQCKSIRVHGEGHPVIKVHPLGEQSLKTVASRPLEHHKQACVWKTSTSHCCRTTLLHATIISMNDCSVFLPLHVRKQSELLGQLVIHFENSYSTSINKDTGGRWDERCPVIISSNRLSVSLPTSALQLFLKCSLKKLFIRESSLSVLQ